MMMSSSPVSSLCVYKLFSSSRVWSRTLCMPRFSSLADDNFSGEKNKGDTVKPQLSDYIPGNIMQVYSFLQVCHRAAFAAQHSARQMCQMCNKCVSLAFLVKLCFMHKHPHTKISHHCGFQSVLFSVCQQITAHCGALCCFYVSTNIRFSILH